MHDYKTPDPDDYGISPRRGFLSPDAPTTAFKAGYYRPWDDLIQRLSSLIAEGNLEKAVASLPLLSTENIQGEIEYRRAYVVLAFLIHGYIWCRSPPNQHIPPQLAEPFLDVCDHLRMAPVLSYAGLCSWNWSLPKSGDMELDNMNTLASFTGTRGEAAFYHVPVLIEAEGGHLVHLLLDAMARACEGQSQPVIQALKETTSTLSCMGAHLSKLYSVLDPHFFYHNQRPFLAGGNGMEEKGLPDGMVFQRSGGSTSAFKLVGGSAAQSSLFPFLDIALSVTHEDRTVFDVWTLTPVVHSAELTDAQQMRAYMPGAHRDFLDAVSHLPSLRLFVEARPDDVELRQAFNECLERLKSWRGKHIAVVSKYIVQPARQAEQAEQVDKIETKGPAEMDKEWELQGTGGSALIPFLRQARDDTVGVERKE